MKKLHSILSLVLSLLLLSSCVPGVRSPQLHDSVLPLAEAERLLASYNNRPSVSSIQGIAKIRFLRNGKWKGSSHVLKLSRPGNIYAETLSLFGQTLAKITSDGSTFSLFVPGENRLYSGVAESIGLKRVFLVGISSDELVSFLLYNVLFSGDEKFDEILRNSEGLTSFYYGLNGRRLVATFDSDNNLVQYRVNDEIEVTYADFSDTSKASLENQFKGPFPRKIEIKGIKDGVALEVTFIDIDFNRIINQADFTIKVPDGTQLVPLLD